MRSAWGLNQGGDDDQQQPAQHWCDGDDDAGVETRSISSDVPGESDIGNHSADLRTEVQP